MYSRLEPFLDEVIDDINASLNSTFPAFSDLGRDIGFRSTAEYTFFPDNYIRSVVCKGAAAKFYVMDEEGSPAAEQYMAEYSAALFIMTRDYIANVPDRFRSENTGSVVFDEKYRVGESPFDFDFWRTNYD